MNNFSVELTGIVSLMLATVVSSRNASDKFGTFTRKRPESRS